MASSTTATDEEKAAMCVKLKEAKAKVEAAINPVTDGTYYIVTTYSAFADKDTMAWFAPYEGNYPGWKKKEPKVLFLWNVKKLDSGNYSIQSLATGQYDWGPRCQRLLWHRREERSCTGRWCRD